MMKTLLLLSLLLSDFFQSSLLNAGLPIDADKSHALFSEAMAELLGKHGKEKSS